MSVCSYNQMSNLSKAPAPAALPVDDVCDAPHLDPRGTEARRGALMSADAVHNVADTVRILGDPTRVRILDALSGGELCVRHRQPGAISESAVSHQLRLLRTMRSSGPGGRDGFFLRSTISTSSSSCARRTLTSRSRHDDLRGVRGPRRIGVPDRGDGLPRGGDHPRAAAETACRPRGARRRRRRPAPQREVRRGEAHHEPYRGGRGADRHACVAGARGAEAGAGLACLANQADRGVGRVACRGLGAGAHRLRPGMVRAGVRAGDCDGRRYGAARWLSRRPASSTSTS